MWLEQAPTSEEVDWKRVSRCTPYYSRLSATDLRANDSVVRQLGRDHEMATATDCFSCEWERSLTVDDCRLFIEQMQRTRWTLDKAFTDQLRYLIPAACSSIVCSLAAVAAASAASDSGKDYSGGSDIFDSGKEEKKTAPTRQGPTTLPGTWLYDHLQQHVKFTAAAALRTALQFEARACQYLTSAGADATWIKAVDEANAMVRFVSRLANSEQRATVLAVLDSKLDAESTPELRELSKLWAGSTSL